MNYLKKSIYIVGIPIGNIYDFSQRCLFILKNVNVIVTEDTKKFGILLKFLNIKNKLMTLNLYNEISISKIIIEKVKLNFSIALVSDSGTPLINDPGYFLINFAYKNSIKIISIPGCSSITTSISISPIKITKFIFKGFLSKKYEQKKQDLKSILENNLTFIFFEVSERLFETLIIIQNTFNLNKQIFLLKDITKKFEKNFLLEPLYITKFIKYNEYKNKGELILIIEGVKKINYLLKIIIINFCKKNLKNVIKKNFNKLFF